MLKNIDGATGDLLRIRRGDGKERTLDAYRSDRTFVQLGNLRKSGLRRRRGLCCLAGLTLRISS